LCGGPKWWVDGYYGVAALPGRGSGGTERGLAPCMDARRDMDARYHKFSRRSRNIIGVTTLQTPGAHFQIS
jgi:hypothetical protein